MQRLSIRYHGILRKQSSETPQFVLAVFK